MTSPNNLTTTYTYNGQGLLAAKTETPPATSPGNVRNWTYAYFPTGLLQTVTTPDGITLNYEYDARSMLTSITDNLNQQIVYEYDAHQNVIRTETRSSDGNLALLMRNIYDNRNRLTETRTPHGDSESISHYTYDDQDRIIQATAPNGVITTYQYDTISRRTQETSPDRGTMSYTYDKANNMTSMTDGRGITTTMTYDTLERMLTKTYPNTINGKDEDVAYTYDKNSNVLGIDTNHEDNTYQYDRLDRITSDTIDTNTPFSFSYDSNDNRKTKTTTDIETTLAYLTGSNRLTVLDTLLQSKAQPPTPIPNRALSYNDVGRLYQLMEAGNIKAAYVYNDMGQRTHKTVYEDDSETTTIYHYDLAGILISETTETGQLIKDYLYNGMTPVAQIDNTATTETITYLHPDHLMTARLATNQSQQIIWRWEGEVFGNTPAQEFTNITINHRFPGQYFDSETNLHYNWNRYYDPQLGRYITSDPIGLSGGMNTYGYVYQNPLSFIDPFGLESTGEWIEYAHVVQGSIGVEFIGWSPTLGLDKYITLLLVRANFEVSGDIAASVRCTDECGEEQNMDYNNGLSSDEHIDLGINIPASAGSKLYGWKIGTILNLVIADLKFNEGLQGLGKSIEAKAAIINAYGPDLICNKGWPSI